MGSGKILLEVVFFVIGQKKSVVVSARKKFGSYPNNCIDLRDLKKLDAWVWNTHHNVVMRFQLMPIVKFVRFPMQNVMQNMVDKRWWNPYFRCCLSKGKIRKLRYHGFQLIFCIFSLLVGTFAFWRRWWNRTCFFQTMIRCSFMLVFGTIFCKGLNYGWNIHYRFNPGG